MTNNNNALNGNARAEQEQYRFRVLDALYTISRGYTRTTISIDDLYRQLLGATKTILIIKTTSRDASVRHLQI